MNYSFVVPIKRCLKLRTFPQSPLTLAMLSDQTLCRELGKVILILLRNRFHVKKTKQNKKNQVDCIDDVWCNSSSKFKLFNLLPTLNILVHYYFLIWFLLSCLEGISIPNQMKLQVTNNQQIIYWAPTMQ